MPAGFVHSCLAKAAGLAKDPAALIRALIAASAVAGFDETWHAAREQGLPAVPAEIREPLEPESRRAVTAGLSAAPRVPGPKTAVKQKPRPRDA